MSRAEPEAARGAQPKASTERVRVQGKAFTLDDEGSTTALRQGGEVRVRATPAATRPAASRASSDPDASGTLAKPKQRGSSNRSSTVYDKPLCLTSLPLEKAKTQQIASAESVLKSMQSIDLKENNLR